MSRLHKLCPGTGTVLSAARVNQSQALFPKKRNGKDDFRSSLSAKAFTEGGRGRNAALRQSRRSPGIGKASALHEEWPDLSGLIVAFVS